MICYNITRGSEHRITRESGGIGRRARLRGVWLTPYGFKSRFSHQSKSTDFGRCFLIYTTYRRRTLQICGNDHKLFYTKQTVCGWSVCFYECERSVYRIPSNRTTPPSVNHQNMVLSPIDLPHFLWYNYPCRNRRAISVIPDIYNKPRS